MRLSGRSTANSMIAVAQQHDARRDEVERERGDHQHEEREQRCHERRRLQRSAGRLDHRRVIVSWTRPSGRATAPPMEARANAWKRFVRASATALRQAIIAGRIEIGACSAKRRKPSTAAAMNSGADSDGAVVEPELQAHMLAALRDRLCGLRDQDRQDAGFGEAGEIELAASAMTLPWRSPSSGALRRSRADRSSGASSASARRPAAARGPWRSCDRHLSALVGATAGADEPVGGVLSANQK